MNVFSDVVYLFDCFWNVVVVSFSARVDDSICFWFLNILIMLWFIEFVIVFVSVDICVMVFLCSVFGVRWCVCGVVCVSYGVSVCLVLCVSVNEWMNEWWWCIDFVFDLFLICVVGFVEFF